MRESASGTDPTPAPTAPIQSIVREARETESLQTVGPQTAFEYGRELVLPLEGGVPMDSQVEHGSSHLQVFGSPAASTDSLLGDEPSGLSTTPGSAPTRSLGLSGLAPRAGEVVIPVTLTEGGRCEILLRIVLSQET